MSETKDTMPRATTASTLGVKSMFWIRACCYEQNQKQKKTQKKIRARLCPGKTIPVQVVPK